MSERIYKSVTEDFIRRMRNWAADEAQLGVSGSGVKISSCYGLGVRVDRYVSSEPPILRGEASDTALALLEVPIRYRQAVQQFWRYEERPLRWHARHLRGVDANGKAFSYHTFESWVIKGHEHLLGVLVARSTAFHAKEFQLRMQSA